MTNQWLRGAVSGALFGASMGACLGAVLPLASGGGDARFLMASVFMLGLGIAGMVTAAFFSYCNQWDSIVRYRWVRIHVAVTIPVVYGVLFWTLLQPVWFDAKAATMMYLSVGIPVVVILPFVILAIRLAHRMGRKSVRIGHDVAFAGKPNQGQPSD